MCTLSKQGGIADRSQRKTISSDWLEVKPRRYQIISFYSKEIDTASRRNTFNYETVDSDLEMLSR